MYRWRAPSASVTPLQAAAPCTERAHAVPHAVPPWTSFDGSSRNGKGEHDGSGGKGPYPPGALCLSIASHDRYPERAGQPEWGGVGAGGGGARGAREQRALEKRRRHVPRIYRRPACRAAPPPAARAALMAGRRACECVPGIRSTPGRGEGRQRPLPTLLLGGHPDRHTLGHRDRTGGVQADQLGRSGSAPARLLLPLHQKAGGGGGGKGRARCQRQGPTRPARRGSSGGDGVRPTGVRSIEVGRREGEVAGGRGARAERKGERNQEERRGRVGKKIPALEPSSSKLTPQISPLLFSDQRHFSPAGAASGPPPPAWACRDIGGAPGV